MLVIWKRLAAILLLDGGCGMVCCIGHSAYKQVVSVGMFWVDWCEITG